MDHKRLFSGLRYCGRVRSVRRDYHVFKGSDHYVVVSPKDGVGGNYTVVTRAALNYIVNRLGGTKSISTPDAFKVCKRSRLLRDRFTLLNAMYALVGIKAARITKVVGQKLFFSIRKGPI